MNLLLLEEADFIAADRVVLRDRRLKHMQEVHRAEVGDSLRVGRINGLLGSAELLRLEPHEAELRVSLDSAPPEKLPITLLLALKDGEAWLMGCHITPLKTASTHVIADPTRTRKLLLNKRELEKLTSSVQQKGYACVALSVYWKEHLIKCEIALGKGKKEYDKRHTERERDSDRELQRAVRSKGKDD